MFVYKTKVYILIAFIYYSERVQNHRCWGFPDSMHSSRRFFFTWHHLRRVFAKLVLAEISNIEFAKTRTDFFLSYLKFSVKMNLLLVPVLVFGSVIQKIFLEKIILKKNTPPWKMCFYMYIHYQNFLNTALCEMK